MGVGEGAVIFFLIVLLFGSTIAVSLLVRVLRQRHPKNNAARLNELTRLREQGLISANEYEDKRNRILREL